MIVEIKIKSTIANREFKKNKLLKIVDAHKNIIEPIFNFIGTPNPFL